MKAESLLVSAAINIGLAILILSLFSILKNQPFYASVYYARRLHLRQNPFAPPRPSALHRLLPSVDWIRRAVRVSEDEIFETHGLDVLVFIRFFKFGINFFVVCSLIGMVVLLPLNYTGSSVKPKSYHSMDAFAISNISSGSNRLWVHFSVLCFVSCYALYLLYKNKAKSAAKRIEDLKVKQSTNKCSGKSFLSGAYRKKDKIEKLEEKLQELHCKIRHVRREMMLQEKELPVAFVTFKSRWGAVIAAQSQQHSNPLLWITEMAPEPRDVLWRNLATPYRILPIYEIGILVAVVFLTLFFAIPVTAVQGIAKYERLSKWFPPVKALELIPGLKSVVTGYLPSAILNGFIYIIPFAMIGLSRLAGYITRSKKEMKACKMVFYFLVANVFFLSLLSGSLLDQIGQSFSQPKNIPSRLASAVSAQADFFMTYILTNGLSGFSLEILQPGLLIWDAIKPSTWDRGKERNPYLYSLPYYRIIPFVALCTLIGIVYAVVSPLLLPFLVGYFLLGYVVVTNQIEDVYITSYETHGQFWPCIHHYIIVALVIMQITMIGLFGLKSKPSASFATIPLMILTLLFNEYCKIRFYPSFRHLSVQDATTNDELDQKDGVMEENVRNALDAYSPPCLLPMGFEVPESGSMALSGSTQPLLP
ncbi:PREDICTED: CSC1-like protein At3g54510 isoform X4 [Ipomoea nil]|uniref:CSC1-like protein At3g54510 isoform X4 n=1 Tax=Ipomoea nil TaxID=35883 RepID=UPI000901F02C|nr:PREDICTED: CSC1-like protein At3g54510 isoform X4 [Ipomoea nil]